MGKKKNYWDEPVFINDLTNQIPAAIFWKNTKSVFLGCNQYFATLADLACPKEIIGKTDYELPWGKHQGDLYRKDDLEIIRTQQPKMAIEESQTLKNGQTITLLTNKIPLLFKGNVIGLLGVFQDITSRKTMEQNLEKARDQAEAANHAKTEFISNMSHDIRTPLTGVVGMAQLLEESAQNDEQKQYARWIYQSGEQLLNMLNGILDLVSTDNVNEYDLHEETFDLRDCIEDIVQLELPTTTLKKLNLKVKIDKKAPRFLVSDRTKIHRILLNLLSNAIKFTEKGHVTIEVACLEKTNEFAKLHFGIRDTGIGIPPEVQEKVFDRFFRISPSYKGVYKGNGLGLHIAQSYAKLLGSTIKLQSQVGVGTYFHFEMSCKIGKANTSKPMHSAFKLVNDLPDAKQLSLLSKSANQSLSATTPLILLVEDNEIARHVAESIASKAGCRFVSAADGEEALALAKSNQFDLILTDVGLPGISGHELTRRIRKEEAALDKAHVPIIGLTAHARENERSLKSGMNAVFTKPINLTTLQTVLKQFVTPATISSAQETPKLGADLPVNESELFELDKFPVLDTVSAAAKMGSESFLREMLELMLNKAIPEDLQTIEKAYESNNWELVEKIAHRMKGGAIYCGTVKLQYACQYLERYRKAGHASELNALYQQLMRVIEETMLRIKEWLGG